MRGDTPSRAPKALREPLLTFLAAIALASALFWVGRAVPFVHRNLHAGIALIFFYAPVAAAHLGGRRFDFRQAGLRLDPLPLNLAVFAAVSALTLPLFTVGFFAFYGLACGPGGEIPALVHRLCPTLGVGGWLGWGQGHLRLPPDFALLTFNQVIVVALPEEMFFRGYLLGRLESRWPARRRLLGAPVGRALIVSAALFALGHFLVDFNPQRLAVFFPALVFGWMRARTGSVAPGTAYHALCNLVSEILHTSYF